MTHKKATVSSKNNSIVDILLALRPHTNPTTRELHSNIESPEVLIPGLLKLNATDLAQIANTLRKFRHDVDHTIQRAEDAERRLGAKTARYEGAMDALDRLRISCVR